MALSSHSIHNCNDDKLEERTQLLQTTEHMVFWAFKHLCITVTSRVLAVAVMTLLLLQSKAVAEHVGVLLDADEKFLIFSHHADMHNAVEAAVRG